MSVYEMFRHKKQKGFKLGDKVILYKFAYLPTRMSNGKFVWLKKYKERNKLVNGELQFIDKVEAAS